MSEFTRFLDLVTVSPDHSVSAVSGIQNSLVAELVTKQENQANLQTDRENAQSVKPKKLPKKQYALSTGTRQDNAFIDYKNGITD